MSFRFAANLSRQFTEVEFLDRLGAAARAGFAGVEFDFPYAHEKVALAEAVLTADVDVVQFALPAGAGLERVPGLACDPARKAEFQDGVGRAIEYAEALGCPRLNCPVGVPPAAVAAARAFDTLVDNLRFAAAVTRRASLELLLEPMNPQETPGVFIASTAAALRVLDAVNCPNLRLLYDVYHAQRMEGDLVPTLERLLGRIGHIQVADNPGRGVPGSGEINFDYLFGRLRQLGYAGWIGCEYVPSGATTESLGWLDRWR